MVSHEVIINLIAATTTKTGLTVYARLDDRDYPKGIEISDAELAAVNLHPDDFHRRLELQHHPITNRVVSP